jgi:similar to spore coat protein
VKQLDEAIESYEKISIYMMQHGLYHPYHIPEQIQLDLKNMQTAMNLPS